MPLHHPTTRKPLETSGACCLGRAFVVDRDHEDKAPYVVTGTVKEVVFDVKPAHHDAEMALHEHAAIQAVGQGAAG